jgi:hypothetical protein
MTDALRVVTVDHPRIPGGDSSGARVLRLAKLLETRWHTDRHIQQGWTDHGRRAVKADVGATRIVMVCIAVDVDGPDHVASDEWRAEARTNAARLFEARPGIYYETRGGARILYALATPIEIASLSDADRWAARYLALLAELERDFGITGDPSCADFTRLFRLPRVKRDPDAAVEDRLMIGDPSAIGAIELPEAEPSTTTPTYTPGPSPREPQQGPRTEGERRRRAPWPGHACLVFRLASERGYVLDVRDDGSAVIRCPNHEAHSCGRDGDGSTMLYPPAETGWGVIHCKHASCQGIDTRAWIMMLRGGEESVERVARIEAVGAQDVGTPGERIVLRLVGKGVPEWLRVYISQPQRWAALWEGADVAPPEDHSLAPGSDFMAVLD